MESENKYIETDLGNVAPNPRGEYSETAAYEYLDLVEYGGGSYLCIRETGTITGIAPVQNKNTETWQVLTIPGDLTPEYVAMHDDVVNKAESAKADAASTAADREQVEAMLANVEQLHSDTETAAQEASDSRDSAAGYAAAAEASRAAAAESEKNAQLQVTGFDETVSAAKQEATGEIATARKAAVQAVAAQQVQSVNAVNAAGNAAIEKTSADAEEAKDAKAEAVSAANAAEGSAGEAKTAAEQAKNDRQSAEAAATTAKSSAEAAETAQKAVEGAAEQIETNKAGIEALKEDLSTETTNRKSDIKKLSESKISKFYASNQGETHLTDADNGKIQDMLIYGKSSQDGDPTPDNPVEIKSVVNPTVRVCGKNLLNYNAWKKSNGIKANVVYENNGVTITAIEQDGYTAFSNKDFPLEARVKVEKGETITLSWEETENKKGTVYIFGNGTVNNKCSTENSEKKNISYIVPDGVAFVSFRFGVSTTGDTIKYKNIQIEKGGSVTAYEQYEKQLIALPYTLNAIPVDSDGNITIDGQQYIADYVDVERGKLKRCVGELRYTNISLVSYNNFNDELSRFNLNGNNVFRPKSPTYCNLFIGEIYPTKGISIHELEGFPIILINKNLLTDPSNVSEFKSFLQNNNFRMLGILNTPTEIDLTQEEIQLFKSLATYYPITNISVASEQLDGYTVFNYPINMAAGWNYVKQQISDNRDYIYDMDSRTNDIDTQAAEAYVNSEYAVALTELEV